MTDRAGRSLKNEGVVSGAEFARLFAHYRPRFEMIAYRYVRDRAAAEDLVSDSFMAFWEKKDRLPEDSNYPAYILTIVRNKCLDWLRAQALHMKIEKEVHRLRQRVISEDILSLEAFNPSELFSQEIGAIVKNSLDALPELTRSVFIARRFDGSSYGEIAHRLGITQRRVESELVKAVKSLRLALRDYLPLWII